MRKQKSRARAFAKTLRSRLTDAETILWSRLRAWRDHGLVFRRQHPIGPYIADFASVQAKLVVELDGGGHGADDQAAHDKVRDAFLSTRGWRVVRISNEQVFKDLDTVLRVLADQAAPLRLARARHLPRYYDIVRLREPSTAGEETWFT